MVMTLLNDAEWSQWSARDIAKACGVSNNYVSELKSALSSDDSEKPAERTYTTKHGTTARLIVAAMAWVVSVGSGGGMAVVVLMGGSGMGVEPCFATSIRAINKTVCGGTFLL